MDTLDISTEDSTQISPSITKSYLHASLSPQ